LDKKETEGLNVVFENRVIHTGKTMSIDDQFGIEIAETTQLNEIVYNENDYISVQLGSTALTKQEIAALHQGSYIILKQRAGEFTQILRSGKLAAVGEICIADDTFAIRVVEVREWGN
jgi:flagellar motor switch/type III secretory pathway protein FliN